MAVFIAFLGVMAFIFFVISLITGIIMVFLKREQWKKVMLISLSSLVVFVICIFAEAPSPTTEPVSVTQETTFQKDLENNNEAQIDLVATKTINQYMYNNYGGAGNVQYATTWYGLINNIEVNSKGDRSWADVYTEIYPDTEGEEIAQKIGNVILYSGKVNLNAVTVHGQQGSLLYTATN